MFASLLLALVQLAVADPAPAATPTPPEGQAVPPPKPAVITPPVFARKAGPEDIARVYPEKARKARAKGKVILTCKVLETGLLDACQATNETPADMGFGEAALKLAPSYRLKPYTRDGQPVAPGSTLRLVIDFPGPPPNVDEAATCYGELVRHNLRIADDDMARPWQGKAEAYAYRAGPEEGLSRDEVRRRLDAAAALPDDGSTSLKYCWDLL